MSQRLLLSLVTISLSLSCLVSSSPAAPSEAPVAAAETARRYVPLLKDPDALVRKRAAVALKRMGAKAKSAVPALEEALADKDADVRAAVAAALEVIDPMPRPDAEKPALPLPEERSRPPVEKPFEATNPIEPGKTPRTPPSSERAEVGSYFLGPKSPPSILVSRKADDQPWRRLKAGARVFAGDKLVSLPGYASKVRLDSGVHLLLRGHVPEFSLFPDMNYLQESAVVLHKRQDADADLTLQCGRLYLSNHKDKGAAVVHLRFEKETWTLTLQPGAEVVLDLLKRSRGDVDYLKGEPPVATLHLLVLQGKAGLSAGQQHFPDLSEPPGPAYFVWNNKGARAGLRGPIKQESVPIFFRPVLPVDPVKNPYAEKMELALKQLSQRMLADKDPTVVLKEVLQKTEDPMQHQLAIYCLGALDEVSALLDVLGDTDITHARERDTAVFTLRRWLGRDARNGLKLFDPKTKTGLLKDKKMYTTNEAERILALLHDFDEEQIFNVETYDKLARDLLNTKVALAELARWHLYRLAKIQGVSLPSLDKFNAAAPRDVREVTYRDVQDKIEKGELPLRAPLPGKGSGPAKPKGK